MARRFTSGFELQSAANGIEFYTSDAVTATPAINTSLTHVRSGSASLRCQNPASGTWTGVCTRFTAVADGVEIFVSVYLKIATAPNVETSFIGLGPTTTPGNARLTITPSRTINMYLDTSSSQEQVGSGTTVLALGTWYEISFRIKRDATTPNALTDQAEYRINGASEGGGSAFSISQAPTRLSLGVNMVSETCTACDFYLDDLAMNDSTGTAETSWPDPDRAVAWARATGAGEFAQSMTLAGSVPAASVWEAINDLPPQSTPDVDYVTFTTIAANWTGTGSRFAVAITPTYDQLPWTPTRVNLVTIGARVTNFDAATSAYVLSVQTSNGGTKATDSSAQSLQHATEWQLNNNGATRASNPYTLYADPSGSPWTPTTVADIQILMRGSDVSPNFHATAVWAMIEYGYTAGGGGGGGSSADGLLLRGAA
jgi:hypothetical protein